MIGIIVLLLIGKFGRRFIKLLAMRIFVLVSYTTLLAWAVSTLFYQVVEGHNVWFLLTGVGVLLFIFFGLRTIAYLKRNEKVKL